MEPRKESRKQEYLRKMGLSQEGDDMRDGPPGHASVVGDSKVDGKTSKGTEGSREESGRLSSRYRKQETKVCEDAYERNERLDDIRAKERKEGRESTSNKTKDWITKLQVKKDDVQDKERRDDCRRKDDSKTKDIISKLREKQEKEAVKGKERKSENFRTQGLVSKMLEKQSKTTENQSPEEKRSKAEEKKDEVKSKQSKMDEVPGNNIDAGGVELLNHSASTKETDTKLADENAARDKVRRQESKDIKKSEDTEKVGNCVAKPSPQSKTKEAEDEDEDSSMFDELMEQVRSDDSSLSELNVNNSEVIKTKTLIEFAQALSNNTNVKRLAMANCRADDHVAYAVAGMLRTNKSVTSVNLDSNHLTGKGILSLIQALLHNSTLTELRFHNQRHICGGKTEMEMTKILKDNTTLLKLGYHFELAGPRMTVTNILSRNMDRQRQKRLQEQKLALANGEKKGALELPKAGGGGSLRNSPKASPKPSPVPSPMPSPKLTPKKGAGGPAPPPPPPPPPGGGPPPPPPPPLDVDNLRNSLTPVSQRKNGKGPGGSKNSRDQLLASIRGSNKEQLKKVRVCLHLPFTLLKLKIAFSHRYRCQSGCSNYFLWDYMVKKKKKEEEDIAKDILQSFWSVRRLEQNVMQKN